MLVRSACSRSAANEYERRCTKNNRGVAMSVESRHLRAKDRGPQPRVRTKSAGLLHRALSLQIAATVGGLLFAFEIYLLGRWFSSAAFKRVPVGPTPVPDWMKLGINLVQITAIPILFGFLYLFLVRPWMKDRRVSVDGLLCLAFILTSIYDPLSAYFHNWIMYNSYFVNWGNPLSGIPGWHSFAQPGAMVAWPVLFIVPGYVFTVFPGMKFGCWVLRRARIRWPHASVVRLMACCFVAMLSISIVLESQFYMRLGWYAEVGSPAINGGRAFQNPWANVILAAVLIMCLSSFRFFTDDCGQTLVERGATRFQSVPKQTALRFFAILAAVQVIFIGCYHIPMALWKLRDRGSWPTEIQSRSYLTNNLCGAGTTRSCPPD